MADNATVVSTSTRNFPNRLGKGNCLSWREFDCLHVTLKGVKCIAASNENISTFFQVKLEAAKTSLDLSMWTRCQCLLGFCRIGICSSYPRPSPNPWCILAVMAPLETFSAGHVGWWLYKYWSSKIQEMKSSYNKQSVWQYFPCCFHGQEYLKYHSELAKNEDSIYKYLNFDQARCHGVPNFQSALLGFTYFIILPRWRTMSKRQTLWIWASTPNKPFGTGGGRFFLFSIISAESCTNRYGNGRVCLFRLASLQWIQPPPKKLDCKLKPELVKKIGHLQQRHKLQVSMNQAVRVQFLKDLVDMALLESSRWVHQSLHSGLYCMHCPKVPQPVCGCYNPMFLMITYSKNKLCLCHGGPHHWFTLSFHHFNVPIGRLTCCPLSGAEKNTKQLAYNTSHTSKSN